MSREREHVREGIGMVETNDPEVLRESSRNGSRLVRYLLVGICQTKKVLTTDSNVEGQVLNVLVREP